MSAQLFLYLAFGLWVVGQVNDLVNAFLNRDNVPKMFWLSAGASFLSGLFLFKFLNITYEVLVYLLTQ